MQRRTADRQLPQKMMPLMLDLTSRNQKGCLDSCTADLAAVEGVAASHGLGMNAIEVGTDRGTRRSMKAKALKLRMMAIATRVAAQHGASQQCFSPQRDKALRIEVTRMQRPKPHSRRLTYLSADTTGFGASKSGTSRRYLAHDFGILSSSADDPGVGPRK